MNAKVLEVDQFKYLGSIIHTNQGRNIIKEVKMRLMQPLTANKASSTNYGKTKWAIVFLQRLNSTNHRSCQCSTDARAGCWLRISRDKSNPLKTNAEKDSIKDNIKEWTSQSLSSLFRFASQTTEVDRWATIATNRRLAVGVPPDGAWASRVLII